MGYTFQQYLTFLMLWLAYGSTYLLRKPFGFMKQHIKAHYGLAESSLGSIDLAFLLPYALGSLLMAGYVDRMGPRRVLVGSLLGSSLATLGLFYATSYWSFLFLLSASGLSQSFSWPSSCSLLVSWFPETPKSLLFSYFGTTCFVWSLLGSLLPVAIEVLVKDFTLLDMTYVVAAAIVLVLAAATLCLVQPLPAALQTGTSGAPPPSRLALSCLLLPIVKEVSLTMFFIKAVRYAFMFWLPYYLIESLGYTAIAGGLTAVAFDVGGIFGSILIGVVSERVFGGREVLASIYSLSGSILAIMVFFSVRPDGSLGWVLHATLLALIGALNCGPDIVFTGSMAAQLGERYNCPGAITGAVNGMGSLGTVTEGPLVSLLAHYWGLSSLSLIVGLLSLAALFFAHKANQLLNKERRILLIPDM